MEYPEHITPEIDEVLGLLTYNTTPLARAYRDAGIAKDLPRKIEREQAFMLHKMILLALKHGEKWKDAFREELKPVLDKAEQNLKSK